MGWRWQKGQGWQWGRGGGAHVEVAVPAVSTQREAKEAALQSPRSCDGRGSRAVLAQAPGAPFRYQSGWVA